MDFVAGDGNHLGGYIVPGFNLMRSILVENTMDVVVHSESSWEESGLGDTTENSINNGILSMVLGFVESLGHCSALSSAEINWYITGGDGKFLAQHCKDFYKLEADLVLDGLELAIG